MNALPRLYFPELVQLANAITFDGVADVQVEHRCIQLMKGFDPAGGESFPAAQLLAKTLRLVVGNRMVAAEASDMTERATAAQRAGAFAAVAGALMPIVLAEKAEAQR
jgi:hypothetical protein